MFYLKKVSMFTYMMFLFYICFVPQTWGDIDWSTGTLIEQMVSPPEQITTKIYLGSSVAISNDYAIIGAKKDDSIVYQGGAASIYEKNEGKWSLVKRIDAQKSGYLGRSVALAGNFAFASAPAFDIDDNQKDVGIVYVYQRQKSGDWVQTQTLFPDPIETLQNFGTSMATSNDTQLIVGGYGSSDHSGKAFIFELEGNQWIQRHYLEPEEPDIGGRFGIDVDIYNDYVIVGAYKAFSFQGAVYIFHKEDGHWIQKQRIISPYNHLYSFFGYSVSIHENYAVVGSKSEQLNDYRNAGAVYVYRRTENSWEQMPKLVEPDLQKEDRFGESLDIKGNILAVGSPKMDAEIVNSGAVNIYRIENDHFVLLRKITAKYPQEEVRYGCSLVIDEHQILVGSESYDNYGVRNGSAFFYSFDPYVPNGVLGLDDAIQVLKILSDTEQ